jgi:hexosaminidase
MPWPADLIRRAGQFNLPEKLDIRAVDDARDAAELFASTFHRLTGRTAALGEHGALSFEHDSGDAEAYSLTVDNSRIRLAGSRKGWVRGAATLLQLVRDDRIPSVEIRDHPRFRWRGVMIDPSRRFLPVDLVKRFIESMTAMKLNVLHLHLSDDQGFRVESRRFPRLHQLASDAQFYTQEEIREIVTFAQRRAIRVIPEFDVPGHATSWLVAYPHLGSQPGDEDGVQGRYELQRRWGSSSAALDPTREDIYRFLDEFVEEMATLFPDPLFHIGGDEVLAHCWTTNLRIVSWMKEHGMDRTHDLQVHFNQRLAEILEKHGRRMMGWDEILHEDLPSGAIVQSWRGQSFFADALHRHDSIQSTGYYLDQLLPASYHYRIDPEAHDLDATAGSRVLGGEACLWGEFIGAENFETRAWPRLCAIAERLWSPSDVRDLDSMYRRLAIASEHLERLGAMHVKNSRAMLARLVGENPDALPALETLASVVEPVKFYDRAIARIDTARTSLTRLVDSVSPESSVARHFAREIALFLSGETGAAELRALLSAWRDHRVTLEPAIGGSTLLREVDRVSQNLSRAAEAGLDAIDKIEGGVKPDDRWWLRYVRLTERSKAPSADLVLVVLPALRQLIDRAAHRG